MMTFYQLIHGCWVKVTTSIGYYHALRHIAGAVIGGCVAVQMVPAPYHRIQWRPMPVQEARSPVAPPSTIYMPPRAPEVDAPPDMRAYMPPDMVPMPEPGGLLVLAVGIGALLLVRRRA